MNQETSRYLLRDQLTVILKRKRSLGPMFMAFQRTLLKTDTNVKIRPIFPNKVRALTTQTSGILAKRELRSYPTNTPPMASLTRLPKSS